MPEDRSTGIPVPAYSAAAVAPAAKAGRSHVLPRQGAGGSKRGRISILLCEALRRA